MGLSPYVLTDIVKAGEKIANKKVLGYELLENKTTLRKLSKLKS